MVKANLFLIIFGFIVVEFVLIILSHPQAYGQVYKSEKIDQGLISIPVGKGSYSSVIDPITHKVYVTNSVSDTVSVIDGTTEQLSM